MQLTIQVGLVPNGCIAIDTAKLFATTELSDSFDQLMAASAGLRYVVDYGWKQSLADATAMTKEKRAGMTPELYLALVEKKRDAIFAGTLSPRGAPQAPVDPIHAEAVKIAKARWLNKSENDRKVAIAAIRAANFAGKSTADSTDEKVVVYILLQMAAALRDEAERNLRATSAVAVDEETVAAAQAVLAGLLAS